MILYWKWTKNVKKLRLQYRNLQISVFLMLHPIYLVFDDDDDDDDDDFFI